MNVKSHEVMREGLELIKLKGQKVRREREKVNNTTFFNRSVTSLIFFLTRAKASRTLNSVPFAKPHRLMP